MSVTLINGYDPDVYANNGACAATPLQHSDAPQDSEPYRKHLQEVDGVRSKAEEIIASSRAQINKYAKMLGYNSPVPDRFDLTFK